MIVEFDTVALATDLPDHHLESGDVGTIVMVHGDGLGYEVEFASLGGETIAVVTLPADSVRTLRRTEIAHAREFAWAQ